MTTPDAPSPGAPHDDPTVELLLPLLQTAVSRLRTLTDITEQLATLTTRLAETGGNAELRAEAEAIAGRARALTSQYRPDWMPDGPPRND